MLRGAEIRFLFEVFPLDFTNKSLLSFRFSLRFRVSALKGFKIKLSMFFLCVSVLRGLRF
jgi:hypothetical protein